MKTKKFYCKIFLALLLAGFMPRTGLLAQQYEKSRNLTRVYPATEETSVQIINKYGNVQVLPWEKDSIRFEISINVQANKQSKVDKTFESIEIEFSESSYYVIAQTVFGNQKSAFWADVSDFTSSMLNSGSNAQIDYIIYLPVNVELSIELKFGNLYMTDHQNKTTAYLSNGDFRGGNFSDLTLDHSFGIVHVDSMRTGSMTLAYSELRMNHAGNIRISSKSSKSEIKSFHNIRLNSRRDTYFFRKAGTISGETSFSYLTLEKLAGDLILTMNYGNLDIGGYGKNFSMLNLNADYTDVKLICSTAGSYTFEAYYNHKTQMIYPAGTDKFEKKEINADNGEYLITGYCGKDKTDAPGIKLTMNGGSVNLIQQ